MVVLRCVVRSVEDSDSAGEEVCRESRNGSEVASWEVELELELRADRSDRLRDRPSPLVPVLVSSRAFRNRSRMLPTGASVTLSESDSN